MKNKKNERTKNKKGITLVALVVTIVVLIILAGISINLAVGDNGVISKAKQAKEMQEMSDVHDKLELIRGKVAVDNETIVTWDKYKDELIKENIITGDDDVEDIENGKKQIVTDTGYVAVIEIVSDGTVGKIEIIGKADSLKVNIINVAVTSETSSIKVDVTANRTDNATFKYYYKTEGGEYQTSPVHEGTDLSYTITNLAQDTTYTIKVEATNKNGTVEKEAVARTGEVAPAEGVITFDNLKWTSGKASITVNKTTSDDLQIQYKVNTGSYALIASGAAVSNMNLGDVLTVRLYDGTNYGSSASLTIADTAVPNSATISLSSTSVTAGTSLTTTVTQIDSESGVNITLCKWVFNTTSSNIGTTESSYTDGTFSTTPQTITLPSSTAGTYYLHVLTIDNAGNKIETISSSTKITNQTIASKKGGNVLSTTDNVKLDDDNGSTVTVPAGFKIASDSATVVNNGVVIEDVNGNQFVWVPVTDSSKMYKAEQKSLTFGGVTEYYSLFRESPYTVTTPGSTTGIKEPDALPDFDNGYDYYSQAGFTSSSQMINEFTTYYKAMIEGINKYYGFYIGRYELTGTVDAPKQKAGVPLTNQTWYSLYKACKGVITGNAHAETRMVWGCQWDETMSWLVTSGGKTYAEVNTDSSGWGNYYNSRVYSSDRNYVIKDSTNGTKLNTGVTTYTKANNIYDLAGNCYEWTQEACGTGSRICRGGTIQGFGSDYPASTRKYATNIQDPFWPIKSFDDRSSRTTLYIK